MNADRFLRAIVLWTISDGRLCVRNQDIVKVYEIKSSASATP